MWLTLVAANISSQLVPHQEPMLNAAALLPLRGVMPVCSHTTVCHSFLLCVLLILKLIALASETSEIKQLASEGKNN